MEVADGVYTLPITVESDGSERTFTPTAVETERGLLLVDVGLPGRADDLEGALGDHGFGLDDVDLVFLTHHDGDHAGCLAEVVERTDAPVFTHWAEAPYVDGRKFPLKAGDERYPPARVDVEVVDGVGFTSEAGPLEVVETFGHTPGHCSLHLPDQQLLLAADALTANEDGLQGPSERFTLDMDRAGRSVALLAQLDVEHVVCHHGGHVEAGRERIRELVPDDVFAE